MPHLSLLAGTTSKIVQVPVYDSSSTVGGMLTGLVFNTSSLVAWYNREGASGAATQISLLTATKGTWTTAGFVAVDGTNMPGWYEVHVPNAAIASGAKSVAIQLRGAANMVPVNILIELTAVDNQDAVRYGLTALPNVASGSAGAIPTTGTGSNQISVSSGLVTLAGVTHTGAVIPTVTNLTNAPTSGDLTSTMKTSVENAVWDAARSSHVATGVFGQLGQHILRDATAQAGASTTITLDSSASATDSFYNGSVVYLYSGTGANQSPRTITGYVGSTKVATVSPSWTTAPGATSKFIIWASDDPPFVGTDGRVLVTADSHTAGETVAAVTGAVGSVTARVTANTDQWAGGTIPAPNVTGVPKVDLVDISGSAVSTSTAQLGVNAVQLGGSVPGSATIGTVTTTTTATNLTNAPTSGDLTATMKTSVENAVWDAARSSHVATGVFGQLGQQILRDNTATAGAASSITLDASASTTVDLYKGDVLSIYSGTGSGQSRAISAYSAGRVATVVPNWVTTPDNTSKFILVAQRTPLVGTDTRILTSADSSTSGETVAAVTGNVGGNVTGSVASVTARVTANADQWAGGTIPAPNVTGVPKVDLVDISGSAVSTSTAQLGVNAVQLGGSVPGSATIGTVTTTTTATNLTNAPTSGDFTAAMKTSLNASTPASIQGSTGNPGANPTGSVVSNGSNSATTFKTDRTEGTNDYWKDALLLFTSGSLVGQVKKITAYDGTTKFVTFSAGFTGAPGAADTFQLVNR